MSDVSDNEELDNSGSESGDKSGDESGDKSGSESGDESGGKVTYMKKLSEILDSFDIKVDYNYFSNVDLIKVYHRYGNVYAIPNNDFDPHTAIVKDCYFSLGHNWHNEDPHFVIECEDDQIFKIQLDYDVITRGEPYGRTSDLCKYIGHLYGVFYSGYEYIKSSAYSRLSNSGILPGTSDVLHYKDFTPVECKMIIIRNIGIKLVINDHFINVINTPNGTFTLFKLNAKCIAIGTYRQSHNEDLYRYQNEAGELFALLEDPNTREITLASVRQIIKLIKLEDFKISINDGLYNGYELKDQNNMTLKYSHVYFYNDVFFTENYTITNVRKPNAGKLTKAAI